jgi:hypothetical protein
MTNVGFDEAPLVPLPMASGKTAIANAPAEANATALLKRCFIRNVLPFFNACTSPLELPRCHYVTLESPSGEQVDLTFVEPYQG